MTKRKPKTPSDATPPMPREGGSYIRHPDGSLECVASPAAAPAAPATPETPDQEV